MVFCCFVLCGVDSAVKYNSKVQIWRCSYQKSRAHHRRFGKLRGMMGRCTICTTRPWRCTTLVTRCTYVVQITTPTNRDSSQSSVRQTGRGQVLLPPVEVSAQCLAYCLLITQISGHVTSSWDKDCLRSNGRMAKWVECPFPILIDHGNPNLMGLNPHQVKPVT